MKGMKEEEQLDTEEVIEEEEVATEEVVAEEETETVAEYDIEEDVNALLGGKISPKTSNQKQRPSLKQQSTLRLLKSKKHWKHSIKNNWLTVWSKQPKNSRKELILTLSTLQMSGLTKTNSPSSKVLRPK